MARMDKVIVASLYDEETGELTRQRTLQLICVPRVGDYMAIPETGVLRVDALEWQVPPKEPQVNRVHIHGQLVSPPYR